MVVTLIASQSGRQRRDGRRNGACRGDGSNWTWQHSKFLIIKTEVWVKWIMCEQTFYKSGNWCTAHSSGGSTRSYWRRAGAGDGGWRPAGDQFASQESGFVLPKWCQHHIISTCWSQVEQQPQQVPEEAEVEGSEEGSWSSSSSSSDLEVKNSNGCLLCRSWWWRRGQERSNFSLQSRELFHNQRFDPVRELCY